MSKRVLIEASKIISGDRDGCERYTVELLRGMLAVSGEKRNSLEIFAYIGGHILPLDAVEDVIRDRMIPHRKPEAEQNQTDNIQTAGTLLRLRNRVAGFLNRTLPVPVARALYGMEMAVRDAVGWLKRRGDAFWDFDLIHLTLPQNYRPFVKTRTRIVTTVHDLTHLYFPEFHTRDNVELSSKSMKHLVRKGGHFIAVSESTKRDLMRDYSIKDSRISVIYEACDRQRFRKIDNPEILSRVREKYGIPDLPYFLTLNTLEPRKNLLNTIKAFNLLLEENPDLEVILVISGKKGWKCEDLFRHPAIKTDRIIFTGFVEDEDLPALYSGAIALSYISYYEGFGLPLLEAMSCGTPVIYGNNSSMPEVAGDAGLPAKPDDVKEIKECFRRLLTDDALCKQLRKRTLENAARFSWKKAAEETLGVYRMLLGI
jgi:glycosyltransferase involved in cell wall biosynthesis